MIYIIDLMTKIALVILVVLVLAAIGVFAYFFMNKNRRSKRTVNEEETIEVAFDKKDTREYVKSIEDIRNNMIVTDGGKRFIAGLKCTGFDYFFEQAERQLATVAGMYAFTNTITKPVSYRQYSKPVDLEYTLSRYHDALNARNEELFHVQEDLKELRANLRRDMDHLSPEDVRLYEREIIEAEKKEKALNFRSFHLADQIRKISRYSGYTVEPDTEEMWLYEWTYDPYDFSYDMKPEEIYYRAVKELYSIGETKIHALSNCGVRARRCTTDELIEACRWYSSPVSAARYKMSDIKKSSFFDDIHSSDPYREACERAEAEILEEARIAYLQAVKEAGEQGKGVDDLGERLPTETDNLKEEPTFKQEQVPLHTESFSTGVDDESKKTQVERTTKTGIVQQKASRRRVAGGASSRRPIVRANDVKRAQTGSSGMNVAGEDLIGED